MTALNGMEARLQALREAGAESADPVGWHYLQVLARRMQVQTGTAHALLQDKLTQAMQDIQARLAQASAPSDTTPSAPLRVATPSALARLLQDMRPATPAAQAALQDAHPGSAPLPDNPRVRQFRQQLRKISVKKQVQQAIDLAPQNAGPINSHMLVLRALGLMRDISPDYLERFMTHVDTLLCLENAEQMRLQPARKKPSRR